MTVQQTSCNADPSCASLDSMCHTLSGNEVTIAGQDTAMASTEQFKDTHSQSQHALPLSQPTDVGKSRPVVDSGIKRSHSVWSLSSSSASDSPSLHTSVPNTQLSSEALMLPEEHNNTNACLDHEPTAPSVADPLQPEDLTHFPVGVKLERPLHKSSMAAGVTAKMLGPAFDPEGFVMDYLSKQDADTCFYFTNYVIKPILLSEAGGHAKEPSLAAHPTSDCWAVVLLAVMLYARPPDGPLLTIPSCPLAWARSARAVTLVVKICARTGKGLPSCAQ